MDHTSFLMISMSMEDAKTTLGFPPGSDPTSSEIKDAYLQKVKILHPDVGGDLEQMKALNVAKDILEGKARPTYDRRPSDPETQTTRWQPPKEKKITFEEAVSKGSIPSGVQWLFVTPMQRGPSWSSDESSRGDSTFVAYGRTEQQHVFVGARHYTRHDYYLGGTNNEDIWIVQSIEIPIRAEEGKTPSWLYGNVLKALKNMGFSGRYNSKVIDAQGWKLNDRLPAGSDISIKNWLVNSGQVEGDDSSVAGRKHVVGLITNRSFTEKPGFYEEAHNPGNFRDGKYHGDYYNITLDLDGRLYELSEKDFHRFSSVRLGGKKLLNVIFGDYHYDGSKKQLTRIKTGKKVLGWMAENLIDLPNEAIEILKAAEAQMK